MIAIHQDFAHLIEARAQKVIGPWRLYSTCPPGFEWCPTLGLEAIAALKAQAPEARPVVQRLMPVQDEGDDALH